MGAHQNAVQRTVVLGIAMVSTLLYSTLNTLVGMTIHRLILLLLNYKPSMCHKQKAIHTVAFFFRM